MILFLILLFALALLLWPAPEWARCHRLPPNSTVAFGALREKVYVVAGPRPRCAADLARARGLLLVPGAPPFALAPGQTPRAVLPHGEVLVRFDGALRASAAGTEVALGDAAEAWVVFPPA